MGDGNPCLACGACCAFFRVSFYFGETDEHTPGGVPTGRTRTLNAFRQTMCGTEGGSPRCEALVGEVGRAAACSIYACRPSPCRDFPASYCDGTTRAEACDRARGAHGLTPLGAGDWLARGES